MNQAIHLTNAKKLHFIGIGGTGMSALARILKSNGYEISGSDKNASPFTEQLQQEGVSLHLCQEAQNVHGADIVIYSAAIRADNPERQEAVRLGIPQLERSEALGQLSRQYKNVVAIAGCHGKTTITSMLAKICLQAKNNATLHLGGFVDFMNGGVLIGNNELFITEACEYVESFMHLRPNIVLVNNIDDDHLDYFTDFAHIVATFEKFVNLMGDDGVLLGCIEDPSVQALIQTSRYPVISYGLTCGEYQAANLCADAQRTTFDLLYRGEKQFSVQLIVPGEHNVRNALGAIAVAKHLGIGNEDIAIALAQYTLTRRRFEYYGKLMQAQSAVYHDYAHHPSEIRACLQGAKSVCKGKLYVVFQCNSYTRARTLFCKNVDCFSIADCVLVPDIYPGRETDDGSVHATNMTDAINEQSHNAHYLATFEQIKDYLIAHCAPDDLIVTLGSGDVYIQTRKFL